jgi:NAD(P)-dependent dehydrogenase (short-subunit alcohol dehydrogenase family)
MTVARRTPDPDSRLRLDGKVAVVTGSSRGIGWAKAADRAGAGAAVALVSRSAERLAEAERTLKETHPNATVTSYAANAGEPDEITATVAAAMVDLGRVDILVNNAATNPYYGPLTGIDVPRAHKTTQVNVVGPVLWTQAVWQAWMADHGGAIVNVASLGPYTTESDIGWYAATKAALVQLTKQLAAELAPGVRVNAVAPGIVKTDMARVLWEDKEDALAGRLPLRRLGEPADVAAGVHFLVSDAASWVTGHTLVIDGGALVTPLSGLGDEA